MLEYGDRDIWMIQKPRRYNNTYILIAAVEQLTDQQELKQYWS